MNKQEAIKRIEDLYLDNAFTLKVKEIISQIDEPQKVVIPKFVAEWIEKHKKENWWLSSAFLERENNQLREWLVLCDMDTRIHHQDIFARAWLDGYEIEQEPLYQIFIKNTTNHKNQIQQLVKQGNKWFFCGNDVHRFKTKFTKGQIVAAGFGWVFDCKGVEVKEVE